MARNFMMSRPMAIIYGAILFLLVIWYSKPGVVTSKFVGSWALKGVTTPPSKVLGSLSPGSPASLGTAKQHRPTLRSALPAGDHGMPSGGQDPTLQPPAAPKPRGLTLTTFDGPFFVFAGLFLIAIGLGLRAVVGPRPRRPSVWEAKDAQALGPQWAMATAAPHAGGLSPWELHTRLSVATSTDRLDLADCGLQQLPPEVLQLKGLHELSLSGNHLTALPPGIGELRHLRKLCLAGNRLETVPEELGALAALEVLELHGNDLVALPESLGRLRALKQLCVSGNRLEALPESLGGLARLTHLTAGGNRLRALPASIGGLRALEFLHVHGNALTALPDAVGNLESVQEIYVQVPGGAGAGGARRPSSRPELTSGALLLHGLSHGPGQTAPRTCVRSKCSEWNTAFDNAFKTQQYNDPPPPPPPPLPTPRWLGPGTELHPRAVHLRGKGSTPPPPRPPDPPSNV